MQTRRLFVTAVGALLGTYAGCSPAVKTSGETHWLGDCERDSDCDAHQQCLCGVCSRACSGDGDCDGSRAAQCFSTESAGLTRKCGKLPPNGGFCLAVCSSKSKCPRGEACFQGACLGALSGGDSPDSGDSNGGTADSGTSSSAIAGKFVHVDAGVRFDGSIEPPAPSPLLYGADDSLLGHWAEYGSDGEPCTPEHNSAEDALACMQLDITKDAGGGYVGTAYWLLSANAAAGAVTGPFAPASDRDHGYPTELEPARYRDLGGRVPGERYTAFEGRFAGGVLSFWVGGTESWKDWCALQTPYPFSAHLTAEIINKGYRCVPPDATLQNTDLGKLVLCTVFLDWVNFGRTLDCDPGPDGGMNPICYSWNLVCTCFADGCTVNLRSRPYSFSFAVSGTTMVSTLAGKDLFPSLELHKVSP